MNLVIEAVITPEIRKAGNRVLECYPDNRRDVENILLGAINMELKRINSMALKNFDEKGKEKEHSNNPLALALLKGLQSSSLLKVNDLEKEKVKFIATHVQLLTNILLEFADKQKLAKEKRDKYGTKFSLSTLQDEVEAFFICRKEEHKQEALRKEVGKVMKRRDRAQRQNACCVA